VSPTTGSIESPPAHVGPSAAPGRLAELARLEASLEADWAVLQEAGQGFGALHQAMTKHALDDRDFRARLAEAAAAQEAFLARLDAFQVYQHNHFVEQVSGELDQAVATLRSFYGSARKRGVVRRHRQLQKLARRCRELAPLYGSAKDHQRIAALQRFYAGAVDFSERIRRLDPTMPVSPPPSASERFARLRRAGVRFFRHLAPGWRLVRGAVGVLWAVLGKPRDTGGTPFTASVDRVFRSLGELTEVRVSVTGEEHLAAPASDRSVVLFTPAHRHGFTDNIAFSHLRLSDYCVFNAVDQLPLVPRFLKDRMARTPGLIAVGGGRGSSVERALDALESGVSKNVLIYPEGSVSEGFGGTRPPRPNFGEGLVRRIRAAGWEVELVPITYLDNARFLDLPTRAGRDRVRELRVAVAPRLDTRMIDALFEAGGGAMVGNMLRLAWLENLVSDELHFLGLSRARAIERRLDLELDGIRYWGSLEPAPVSDRLHFSRELEVAVCEEPFWGKRVRAFEIPEAAQDERHRIVVPELRDFDSSELLIGIRPPSHIYLSVGRARFDGDIFRPLRLKQRDTLYPGIVIRFVGIPVKSINAIRRKLEALGGREQRTLTCANSACQVISRAAEIRIDDHARLRPFLPSHLLPTRTIRKIIERGVRDHAGHPIELQIYKTSPQSLEATLRDMRKAEHQIVRDHVRMATVDVARAIGQAARRLVRACLGRRSP